MAGLWLELKRELGDETRKIMVTCPDEIKRFHYGIITHSEAGKYALNQYFGHWVHAYAHFFIYANDMLSGVHRLAQDPEFDLNHLKKMYCDISKPGNVPMLTVSYGGQKTLGKYIDKMIEVLDTLQTKEEFIELIEEFQVFISRLYWWFHWYFPWGIGPGSFQRLLPEDIREITRLSQTT